MKAVNSACPRHSFLHPIVNFSAQPRGWVRRWFGFLLLSGMVSGAAAQNIAVAVGVDARQNQHAISPLIYGVAFAASSSQLLDLNCPVNRSGGNAETRYNWLIDAHNRGADWYFESIADGWGAPGGYDDSFISLSKSGGANPMITIPMIGWACKLGSGRATLDSFSVAKYGPQTATDPYWSDAGNGISTASGHPYIVNNPNDADFQTNSSFQVGWLQHITNTWGVSTNGGVKYYLMDNEHSIWFSTHRDVHPIGPTMQEIFGDIVTNATLVKSNDPNALVLAPEEWGWGGYFNSGYDQQNSGGHDRAANGGWDYCPWLLNQLHQHDIGTGQRLLDYFTLHCYPQEGNVGSGTDVSTTTALLRNQTTRVFWDTTYVDPSWINQVVMLIPRMKNWVAAYYPGTKIGVTEYNWGAEGYINGATAQADIFGIFGREGLDLATRWSTPNTGTPTYNAMKMYRNYDGNKSTFGDTSVLDTVSANVDYVSSFAAVRSSDGAMTVMVINKQLTATATVTLNLTNFTSSGTAQVWQLTSANAISQLSNLTVTANSLNTTVPAQSITLFVMPGIVALPPLVTAEPVSQSVAAGGSVTFSVTASGTAPFSYAWYRNSASIAAATNSSYTTNNVQLADSGSHFVCVISNAYGSVTSSIAALTVGLPPSISLEPTNVSVLLGGTAIFSVGVSGTGPFSYQWQLNGTNLPNGIITTVAGNGSAGYSGDGAAATNASLYWPTAVALDASDSLLIADEQNSVIRKVTANGIITTEAGNGSAGYSGDGGPATNASLYWPDGVTVDAAGNLFIADSANNVIRKVDTNGIITTVAGNGSAGYSGDGGQATNASLSYPEGVALASSGNLLISDWVNNVIRKVDTNGIIRTVAGNGSAGYSGDGGSATNASLNGPYSVALGMLGSLFISDTDNQRIREVDTNGVITTVAGNGSTGYSGDRGMATNASLYYPADVALDVYGNLFIADEQNNVIRKVDTNGIITTMAGNGSAGYSGDGGAATNASLSGPYGLALDICGNLFVADTFNNRVREVMLFASYPTLTLNNVTPNNAPNYTVIITGSYGSVTSSVATLTVTLPAPNLLTCWTTSGLLKFTWAAVPNQTYLVQYTTNLNSTNWLSLGSPITATNSTASASDFIGPDQKRFYRVVLLLSP